MMTCSREMRHSAIRASSTRTGTSILDAQLRLSWQVSPKNKILRLGTARTTINFDIYNALNANTILTYNNAFAIAPTGAVTWQQPTQILQARFFKIGGQFDF